MDKETKALIDFYDNKIKDLEDKNKEKQNKLDEIEEYLQDRKSMAYFKGAFSYGEFVNNVLDIIKGEDK